MNHLRTLFSKFLILVFVGLVQFSNPANLFAQTEDSPPAGKAVYKQIKEFSLSGGKANVSDLLLKRDRVELTFTGTFYFSQTVIGKVTGAVFIGQGNFKAEVPPSEFERNNVKRLLGEEIVESTFKTAVLRFTDDTFAVIGNLVTEGSADQKAQKLASEIDDLILKETGANLSSRIVTSILNEEGRGFFFGNFDDGKRGRFSYVLDYQNRLPTSYFDINGGEKGIIFDYDSLTNNNEIWLAFYGLEDYQNRVVSYSDVNDLIDITHYNMELDLHSPKKRLGLKAKLNMKVLAPTLTAIPFIVGESLGESGKQRLKKQLRLKKAVYETGQSEFIQEDWEGGFIVFLPRPAKAGDNIELEFELDGDFLQQPPSMGYCHYPRSNTSWYPRHGYLDRATYDLKFTHSKNDKIASVGVRLSEDVSAEDKDIVITKHRMQIPVSFVTFAMGPFKRYTESIKWDSGEKPIPLEYNSITYIRIKEDFILAELNNSVRYFHALFGPYPYENFGAAFHPFGFGQGFPSMLLIPDADSANKYTYAFIAHETAHQWWGNIVAWRSYRDQWLSEGFAEYSGVLYTALRQNHKAAENLVDEMRNSLREPPYTMLGPGKGRLADVGPLILGHRLNTSKTYGAYSTLIYKKGALVLRMLHFLFTDTATGNGDPFFAMMKDFVERHRNKTASTDDFRMVANEHFVNTPIAKKHGIKDLDWFFRQWVNETYLPSYGLEYSFEDQADGSTIMTGTVTQENAPDDWAMVLPIVITLKGGGKGAVSALAFGPKNSFKLKLPSRPQKIELDPQKWVLSEKTKTN